jgi:zinc transport system substrate-binding protein
MRIWATSFDQSDTRLSENQLTQPPNTHKLSAFHSFFRDFTMIHLRALFFFTGVLLCIAGTGWGEQNKKISVFTTIEPQAYLLKRIGEEHVEVNVLVAAGQNLHSFEPTPRQMAKLARARIYFTLGLPLEKPLLDRLAGSKSAFEMIDAAAGITRRAIEDDNQSHPHGHAHHDQTRDDPHIWLDPQRALKIAQNMADALIRRDPDHEQDYRRNLQSLVEDLNNTHRQIKEKLAPFVGSAILVYHGAFGYFTDAYGLRQIAVEIGGKRPSARELSRLIDSARRYQIRVVFVQPQFSRSSARTLAEAINGRVATIDPLAPDYCDNLKRMAEAVHNALAD